MQKPSTVRVRRSSIDRMYGGWRSVPSDPTGIYEHASTNERLIVRTSSTTVNFEHVGFSFSVTVRAYASCATASHFCEYS